MTVITGKRIFAVITGASRGIGRQIAISLASDVAGDSAFLLLARNVELLESVKKQIQDVNPNVHVAVAKADFAEQESIKGLEELVNSVTNGLTIETRLIFHNAGTIGAVDKPCIEISDPTDWHNYLQSNVVAAVTLNNALYKLFVATSSAPIFVINITSIASVKAIPSFTQYAVGKAAREAYFRNFALEVGSAVRVLSYSPGPVQTDMVEEIGRNSYDAEMRQHFSSPQTVNTPTHRRRLTPEETVSKLIGVIDKNDFENGGRIDFFDA
uniref:Sepiapterin reductase n=1 Tax=Panagrellus redivivus TaxID=6233 RepID=A0A7E4ZYG3_PANRE